MKNEEAIRILYTLKESCFDCNNCAYEEDDDCMGMCFSAIDVAIEALKYKDSDGCTGCAFESVEEWEMPCAKCKRNCKDYWRAKHD